MSLSIPRKIKFIFGKFSSINFNYFIFIIYLIRIFYVIIFDNNTGDFTFYDKITNGILSGCGFAIETSKDNCNPIIGHFFPGFFYLLSLFYLLNLKAKSFIIFISTLQFFSNLNLFYTLQKQTKNSSLSKYILVLLSLSPLTLGFSRLILMEPLITVFSTLFLSKLIQIYYEGFTRRNYLHLIILQIISIYFKPTSILFSLPFILMAFVKLNINKFFQNIIIWFLTIIIAISPWGYRNIKMGADKPFTSVISSNFYPENRTGYLNWYSTWIITEHEQAINGFPISTIPFKLKLKKAWFNPFISQKELNLVQKRIDKTSDFSSEDNYFFEKESIERRNKLGLLGLASLYTSKMLSLLINPLNSWGWPLEVYSFISNEVEFVGKNSLYEKIILIINPQIISRLFLKAILFIYRITLFTAFLKIVIDIIARKKTLLKNVSLSTAITLSSVTFLFGTLYLIAIHFPSLEHRFISVVAPWIEASFLLYYYKI